MRLLLAAVLFGSGCVSLHEATGDLLLKQGDKDGAIKEYEQASQKRPIIDWDYERLRDKRLAIVEGQWSPVVTEAITRAQKLDVGRAIDVLLEVRAKARGGDATRALMTRLDTALLEQLSASRLPPPATSAVVQTVDERLGLLARLQAASATLEQLQALGARVDEALAVGLPAIPPQGGRARLELLLRWRTSLRGFGFPQQTDARLGDELARLAADDFPPTPLETAVGALEASATLRSDARALGAGQAGLALADAIWNDTLAQALLFVDRQASQGDFFHATQTLGRWAERVEPGPLHQKLAAYAKAGREQALQRAASLGTTGRAYVQQSLALALGSAGDERTKLREALGAKTSLDFKPEVTSTSCASVGAGVASAFPATGVAGRLSIRADSCTITQPDRYETRSASYPSIETRYEDRQVQVGTRLERVQTGTHKEQCSQQSSLPGMVWQGVCDVPDYENKQFPVYETQRFAVETEVTKSLTYQVMVHVFTAVVRGEASLKTDEGTVLTVSWDETRSASADSYAYVLPGKRPGDSGTPVSKALLPGFSGSSPLSDATSAARLKVQGELLAKLTAHRAEVARAAGASANAAGRTDEAVDAYVRSVLISGNASTDARQVLSAALGVERERVEPMLSPGGQNVLGRPSYVSWPATEAWVSKGFQPTADEWTRRAASFERDVSVSTATYQEGIYPPNEFVDGHVGVVPGEIQNGGAFGSRVAVQVGFEGHYSPLEMLGLRYFFAVHDEIGLRFTIGISTAKAREFESGDSETPLAMSIDAAYTLVAGLRLPWFSLMAGGRAGVQHMAVGELQATGFHVEPAVRLALRFFEKNQLILEASGLVGIPGVPFKNRFALSFPLLGKAGVDVKLSVEQTMLPATDLAPDGKTRVQLGALPAHQVGLQVGARF